MTDHPRIGTEVHSAPEPLITLQGISHSYSKGGLEVQALRDVSLDIFPGEFVAITGRSGSGKSTLLNIIGCLSQPTHGDYTFDGERISTLDTDSLARLRRTGFGFVFQSYSLLESVSAHENVQIPAIYDGVSRGERSRRSRDILSRLSLDERLAHLPAELSGGEQQRVALARALVNNASVILADEPTGALDSRTSDEIMSLLETLSNQGHTIIVVTHNEQVAKCANRRIELFDGRVLSDTQYRKPSPSASPLMNSRASVSRIASTLSVAAFWQSVKSAWRSLNAHKFRTALTLLGIIIGILSVIVMVALGEGVKHAVVKSLGSLAANVIEVTPGHNFGLGNEALGEPPQLFLADGLAINEKVPEVVGVLPQKSMWRPLRRARFQHSAQVVGTSPDALRLKDLPLVEGTFFNQRHFDELAPVAVMGAGVKAELFPDLASPVGAYVIVQDTPLRILGVLASNTGDSGIFGFSLDDESLYVPLSTGRVRLFGDARVDTLFVNASSLEAVPSVKRGIMNVLEARHGRQDFDVQDAGTLMDVQLDVISNMTLIVGGIAAISLLVAGIGVMNIMLVSVTQRTREIGIRMACGATRGHVLQQFLLEAVMVCVAGGLVAICLAFFTVDILTALGFPVRLTLKSIGWALAVATAAGLIFGFAPAWRASRLEPATALVTI